MRDPHLDAVKGFAILVVMLGHCIGRNHMNDPYLNDAILTVQMPLFMMVSGYAGGMSKREPGGMRDVWTLQKKRIVSYLLPFFSWVVVVSLLRPIGQMQNPLAECYKILFHIDSGLWFLMTLFLIQLMVMLDEMSAKAVRSAFHKKPFGIFQTFCFLSGAAMIYLGCMIWARSGSSFLGPSFLVQYFPFYLTGYLISHYLAVWLSEAGTGEALSWKNGCRAFTGWLFQYGNRMIWMAWGISFAAFWVMVVRLDLQSSESMAQQLQRMCASFLGSFVCFWGIYHLPVRHRYSLSFIGLYTLEIYALHFRFVDMLGFKDRGLSVYSLEGFAAIIVTFLVMSVLSGILIYLIKKIPVLDLLLFGRPFRNKCKEDAVH